MPILPGAEPFHHDGGPTGVLLCHGFTGSPQSVRPWADYLVRQGLTVRLPLLPGHGTSWRDMATTTSDDWLAAVQGELLELLASTEEVFVFGLSMGGCLALRLAQLYPGRVRGVAVVNPSVAMENKLLYLAPVMKWLLPSTSGIGNDIKRPGAREVGYARVPTMAAATLPKLWRDTRRGLRDLTVPVLVFKSRQDRAVGPESLRILRREVTRAPLTVRMCDDSYHVATLDNDAEMIFEESLSFVREHSGRTRRRTEEGSSA